MRKNRNHQLSHSDFKKLFDSLYTSLCVFANRYLNNFEVSKDIVQEVFIKVWEDNISFESPGSVKSYLYTSVRNRSLDFLKSKTYKSTDSLNTKDIETLELEADFLREVVIAETSRIIEEALNTLPERCAQVIKLSIKDYTNEQIATELSVSLNTVKTHKKIAYGKLRTLLKEHFILIAFIFNY